MSVCFLVRQAVNVGKGGIKIVGAGVFLFGVGIGAGRAVPFAVKDYLVRQTLSISFFSFSFSISFLSLFSTHFRLGAATKLLHDYTRAPQHCNAAQPVMMAFALLHQLKNGTKSKHRHTKVNIATQWNDGDVM